MNNSFIMIGVQSMDASVDYFKNILDFQVEGNQKPNDDIKYISAALPNGTKFLKFQDPNNVNIVLYE